jgi:Flp pilus assembly protein TadD
MPPIQARAIMNEKSARMRQLEALLADDPSDEFVRYGLAMEYASIGDEKTAAEKLLELADSSEYVPAFHQAGRFLANIGRTTEAVAILRKGIEVARRQGEFHTLGEMEGLLLSLE